MMHSLNFAHASTSDGIGLLLFFVLWVGYARYHRWKGTRVPSLMGTMHAYRHDWMTRVLQRDQRIVDASLLANLSNSATFFASTTLLILGALLAMMGTKEKVASVVADLPFATQATEELWEVKIFLLLLIFIYAFFLFTWSLRQFNFASILVGSAPMPGATGEEGSHFILRAGRLLSLAGDSFNNGLRAYYFALAALMWFVHAWLMVAATATVVFVLYWREFRSDTLGALTIH